EVGRPSPGPPAGRRPPRPARRPTSRRAWPPSYVRVSNPRGQIVRERARYTMDQVKEFLRQCVKYRFWISLGVAALFAIIAYFVGSAPVKAAADQKTKTITASASGVKAFSAPGIPNEQYKPIVEEKTE